MLEELTVKDFALIESVHVEFSEGFNILTGETGAGKSILIGALSLLFGEKGETDSIRTGMEEAEVSALIRVDTNPDVMDWLRQKGISPEEGRILIRRILKRTGRGPLFIQTSSMTKQDLQELTSLLFDLHGQHQHQSLLSRDNHRRLLDRYAGCDSLAATVHTSFTALTGKKKEYESMVAGERERLREADILAFAIREIEQAALHSNEEEELEREIRILSDHEKLFNLLDQGYESSAENRGGALALLRKSMNAVEAISGIDDTFQAQLKRLEDAFFEIEDVAETLRDYKEQVEFSPARLQQFEERLTLIHNLEKKYGDTIPDVLRYLEESRQKLDTVENWEEKKEAVLAEIREIEKRVISQAAELSDRRKQGAGRLQAKIEDILHTLGMPDAVFTIKLEKKESVNGKPVLGAYGFDTVEFLISPNKGEPVKPLRNIASGGEMSRIMLAIKSVLAETDTVNTLIFDEIDSGIGGEVARYVAGYLHSISSHRQVLCITHLASIAVRADTHIKVEKHSADNKTVTSVNTLKNEQRVQEIARMLSGDTEGKASLSHAEEMLKEFQPLRDS